jgi:hypothetical protein
VLLPCERVSAYCIDLCDERNIERSIEHSDERNIERSDERNIERSIEHSDERNIERSIEHSDELVLDSIDHFDATHNAFRDASANLHEPNFRKHRCDNRNTNALCDKLDSVFVFVFAFLFFVKFKLHLRSAVHSKFVRFASLR